MDIIIEKATPADAKDILQFLRQIGSETDNLSFGAEGLPFTIEAEADHIRQIEHSPNNIMLLAKENGKIVGNATLDRLPRRMSHRGELSVCVLREYWNCGIGGALLCKILDFAKANSFEMIDLQVRSDNDSAIHLYDKYGFKKIGSHSAFFKIGEKDISFDYMCLKLK